MNQLCVCVCVCASPGVCITTSYSAKESKSGEKESLKGRSRKIVQALKDYYVRISAAGKGMLRVKEREREGDRHTPFIAVVCLGGML